jgi:transcriptional regulator with XRE-family HTH domain
MTKKITIKDIAREAKVSVATVSYVLNNRTDQRISEDTRRKVLQIANLLNYTPNQSAKALATNRSQNVAVYLSPFVTPLKRAEQLNFLNLLSDFLRSHNYNLVYISSREQMPNDNIDCIICYDISAEDFYKIGDNNLIPLLFVDSFTSEPFFFQIAIDFLKLKSAADYFSSPDYTVACLEIENASFREQLGQAFPSVIFIRTPEDLALLRSRNIVIWEETLKQLLPDSAEVFFQPSISTDKLDKIMECMQLAINHVHAENHTFLL